MERPRSRWRFCAALAVGTALGSAGGLPLVAHASAPVYPSALSARIVRFVADPNNTYVIYTRPGMVTDIRLAPGAHLEALALGDTVRWITQQVPHAGDVFIKPVAAGLQTSATLVTSEHTYQMMLVSRAHGVWYQEVRFQPREPLVYVAPPQTLPDPPTSHGGSAASALTNPRAVPNHDHFSDLNLKSIRFGWSIKGRAAFRPLRVFSSPDFVWIELPPDAASPVVFASQHGTGGPWGIVNYDYRGHWIVVQSRAMALQLRAAGQSIELYAPGANT